MILCPRLTFVYFAAVAQTMHLRTYLVSDFFVKHFFAFFENNPISHTPMTYPVGHGAFTRKTGRARLYPDIWRGSRLPQTWQMERSPQNTVGGGGVFRILIFDRRPIPWISAAFAYPGAFIVVFIRVVFTLNCFFYSISAVRPGSV